MAKMVVPEGYGQFGEQPAHSHGEPAWQLPSALLDPCQLWTADAVKDGGQDGCNGKRTLRKSADTWREAC